MKKAVSHKVMVEINKKRDPYHIWHDKFRVFDDKQDIGTKSRLALGDGVCGKINSVMSPWNNQNR